MHKYAVIALPFIFSNLRCFREKICITMPYYVHVVNLVNYNSALQHHPRITDTSDAEDEEVEGCSAISATLLSF
ncbi:hypothetical protein T08_15877 [Trichinella sp. T8]|nr:hypothetical protein T08_15877 [Trichinella sp. T8]